MIYTKPQASAMEALGLMGLGDCMRLSSGGVPTGKCMDRATGYVAVCDANGCPIAQTGGTAVVQSAPTIVPTLTYDAGAKTTVEVSGGGGLTQDVYGVRAKMADDVSLWERQYSYEHGLAREPDECPSDLMANVNQYCSLYPAACAGVNLSALVAELCQHYAAWYAAMEAQYIYNVERGAIEPIPSAPVSPVFRATATQTTQQVSAPTPAPTSSIQPAPTPASAPAPAPVVLNDVPQGSTTYGGGSGGAGGGFSLTELTAFMSAAQGAGGAGAGGGGSVLGSLPSWAIYGAVGFAALMLLKK